jgi:hypothetical protein
MTTSANSFQHTRSCGYHIKCGSTNGRRRIVTKPCRGSALDRSVPDRDDALIGRVHRGPAHGTTATPSSKLSPTRDRSLGTGLSRCDDLYHSRERRRTVARSVGDSADRRNSGRGPGRRIAQARSPSAPMGNLRPARPAPSSGGDFNRRAERGSGSGGKRAGVMVSGAVMGPITARV